MDDLWPGLAGLIVLGSSSPSSRWVTSSGSSVSSWYSERHSAPETSRTLILSSVVTCSDPFGYSRLSVHSMSRQ
jgi:hypothetical protein